MRDNARAMASGDVGATADALAANPSRANTVITGLDAQNTSQRARMANNLGLTSSAAAAILALPEQDQPAAYAALRPGMIAAGVSEGMMPPVYPGAAALVAHRNAAIPVLDGMKMQAEFPSTNPQPPLQQGLPSPGSSSPGLPTPGALALIHQAHAQNVDPALVLASAQLESGLGAVPDRPGAKYRGMLQLGDDEWAANGGTPQNRDDPAMQAVLGVAQLG